MNRPIVLLTDFGLKDPYVAVMKGMIFKINPKALVFDLTHEISSGNLTQAAFLLDRNHLYFPKGSIFVVVVDPGVGSKRKILCLKSRDYFFIAPDNGLLSLIYRSHRNTEIREVTNHRFFAKSVSSTFHGRDIFAPVAGRLSCQDIFSRVGKRLSHLKILEIPKPFAAKDRMTGEIIFIDRFGNLITNIEGRYLTFVREARLKGKRLRRFVDFYSEAKKGEAFLLVGSMGLVEVGLRDNSAAKLLKAKLGDKITLSVDKSQRR